MPDPYGNPLVFNLVESSISEQHIQNIKVFKGISLDRAKRISVILTNKAIFSPYSDQGTEYISSS